jgi:hypothetical protein
MGSLGGSGSTICGLVVVRVAVVVEVVGGVGVVVAGVL